ncbi:MAG TPA: DinB family protein [Vicinamibacterales bacterium]|jgi:uncharacterized damage-inducible protein DinB
MLPDLNALLRELEAEAPATRRVLERIPADRLGWRPHAKSMSAGQLAQHVATIPGNIARAVRQDGLDLAARPMTYAACESPEAVLATFDESIATLRDTLRSLDDQTAMAPWRLHFGERDIFTQPRTGVLRTMCFNHWYHHRGELVVYLRLLDIPVPIVYGRSADENPFGVTVQA